MSLVIETKHPRLTEALEKVVNEFGLRMGVEGQAAWFDINLKISVQDGEIKFFKCGSDVSDHSASKMRKKK